MSAVVTTEMLEQGVIRCTWASLANGETGDAAQLRLLSVRSVQVSGTFGASGAVLIEGSNDGTVWAPLSSGADPTNPLSITAAGIKDLLQATRHVRPRSTAGDGTTALKVTILGM